MNEETFSPAPVPAKNNKKLFLIIGIIVGVAALGIIIFLLIPKEKPVEVSSSEEEPLSPDGLTEAEVSALNLPTFQSGRIITEYNLFDENEFSIISKEEFFDSFSDDSDLNEETETYTKETLYNFFSSVYPEYNSITFLPDSFKDNSFKLKSNTGMFYTVVLTPSNEENEDGSFVPKLSVFAEEGNEIFSYDGRFYISDGVILTDEEALETFDNLSN